jgi:hypothetical protein
MINLKSDLVVNFLLMSVYASRPPSSDLNVVLLKPGFPVGRGHLGHSSVARELDLRLTTPSEQLSQPQPSLPRPSFLLLARIINP